MANLNNFNNVRKASVVEEHEKMLKDKDYEEMYKDMPLTDETSCGIGFLKGSILQRFANKKAYVFLYGILGCVFAASYAYFNGTITTIEKRFKIPSKTTGIITVGNDISQLMVSAVLSYYAGKGHRPRWMALGLYSVVLFCVLTALPHMLYGPGTDALHLTTEYGASYDQNATLEVLEQQKAKVLCRPKGGGATCEVEEGSLAPQVILFIAQFISGVGGSLFYTLGVSYMDDNIKKSKTPALISFSYFLRMLGPAMGYALASLCLKLYISPNLTPTITDNDPRWLGAWWLGWLILAVPLMVFATLLGLFPKTLPRAAMRRTITQEKIKAGALLHFDDKEPELPASLKDMMVTFKRLLTNATLMMNNLASVFYFMGYMPYWIFMPKYIEVQYHQSASVSSLVTGTVGLVFSAVGILISGLVITKWKPRARLMAAWNIFVGAFSVLGLISYAFLGCPANDNLMAINQVGKLDTLQSCNSDCSCDYVRYSPVCSTDGTTTYISACHAGCRQQVITSSGEKLFTECSCIKPTSDVNSSAIMFLSSLPSNSTSDNDFPPPAGGFATPGSCKVDCKSQFYMFLVVVCLLKFSGATGRATNFLVSVRCVEEKDKPVAMGMGLMIMSLFAFIPSPILFGGILDKTCLVWGKTCSGTGNCWLYNGQSLRYILNFTAASFVTIGTIFDVGVWYYVKDLKIFEDEQELKTVENGKSKENEVKILKETNNTHDK